MGRQGVRQTRDDAYQRVRDLYRQADESGVAVNSSAFRGVGADGAERTYVDDIVDTAVEARDGVSFDPVGAAGRAINYLNRQFTGDRTVPLTEIERVRQGLQRIRREAQPHEQASIGDLVDAYDAFMEALPEESIAGGAESGLALYREAREAYRTFRRDFTQAPTRSGATGRTPTDVGGRTLEGIANDNLGAPERVAGMVLGQGDQIGTRHTAAIINRMQQSLGADHVVFSDLRSEVLRRIFNRATADRVDHPAQFARRMTNEVDRAFSENPTVIELAPISTGHVGLGKEA